MTAWREEVVCRRKARVSRLAVLVVLVVAGCRRAPMVETAKVGSLGQPVKTVLNMPAAPGGAAPKLLSEVGAFQELAALTPAAGLMPYDINVSFWSDGAAKHRWIGLPVGGKLGFSAEGEWSFPPGTVFVKNFELPADQVGSGRSRPLIETRVLVCGADGGVAGASYKWRDDGSDADLVSEPIVAPVGGGGTNARNWYFPGRDDCRVCHTPAAGGVLGVKTRQINRSLGDAGENQLVKWNRLGLFKDEIGDIERFAKLRPAADFSATVEDRARSYLDVNCANCHRPGGVAGNFDARFDTPLGRQNLIDGPVLIDLGIDRARVIAPRDVWRSIALARVETSDLTRMPPLAHEQVDREGAGVLRAWIESLPGVEVLEPPSMQPKGGEFRGAVRVVLRHRDAGATIRYTLDGSAPGKSSAVYQGPLEIKGPVTVRARAYKEGVTRSVVVQETFVVND
ncbi:MAG: hypothetical protein JWN40_2306 [Phycisphaerales bacterium]|nr:hypothetical protein [Phycisphaerales bacterium]